MTKTELALKILSYPPTARIDIWWEGGVSNMPLGKLQGLVKEWQEQNIPTSAPPITPHSVAWIQAKMRPNPVDGCIIKEIPEPDPNVLPDHNC